MSTEPFNVRVAYLVPGRALIVLAANSSLCPALPSGDQSGISRITWDGVVTDDSAARAAQAKKGSPFLSPEQAAFYLGLSARTLQSMRARGSGPRFRRHARHVRYHIDDLIAWSEGSGRIGNA